MEALDRQLFARGAQAGRVFMNAVSFSILRQWHRNRLEPVTYVNLLKIGYMGILHHPCFNYRGAYDRELVVTGGRQIWVSRHMPVGCVFIDSLESMTPYPYAGPPAEGQLIRLGQAVS